MKATTIPFLNLVVSVVSIFSSAWLAYYFAHKEFLSQLGVERNRALMSSLDQVLLISDQLGALVRTEGSAKVPAIPLSGEIPPEAEEPFQSAAPAIYASVARWGITADLEASMKAANDKGLLVELKADPEVYDKYISLYWQLRAPFIDDSGKVRAAHIILFNKNLFTDLRAISSRVDKRFH